MKNMNHFHAGHLLGINFNALEFQRGTTEGINLMFQMGILRHKQPLEVSLSKAVLLIKIAGLSFLLES